MAPVAWLPRLVLVMFFCSMAAVTGAPRTASAAGLVSASLPELEAQVVAGVNAERARAGQAPLAVLDALTTVARFRSADMIRRGYFAHVTPDGTSAFAYLDAAGVVYGCAGENIAYNDYPVERSAAAALKGFMHSAGHRENILSERFDQVGVGVALDSDGKLFYTVLFTGK